MSSAPNGWQRGSDIIRAVAPIWPMVLLATQATSFAAPAPASNSVTQFGWYQPLSRPVAVAQAQQGHATVPFNTAQINTTTIDKWQQPLSRAVQGTRAQQGSNLTFVVAPFAVPSGWQAPLSGAPPVAKAQVGSTFVPFNTQIVSTPNGWFGPISPAARTAKAISTQATSFQTPAQANSTVTQFGWYQPLSKAVSVATAQQGHSFVPFDTAQITVTAFPLYYDANTPRTLNVYYQAWTRPPAFIAPDNNTTSKAWYQPLNVAVSVAKARQGDFFVPFNTAQTVAQTPWGWLVPLSPAAKVATASYSQPWVPGPFPMLTIAWVQPLSKAVPVAAPRLGSTFVPLNTAQVVSVIVTAGAYTITGFAVTYSIDQNGWAPATKSNETWAAAGVQNEIWIPATKEPETWSNE